MDKEYWEKQLETAMSKYDFDLMKEAVKNGAEPDNMILHRVINRDRVDLVEYFCFSPELEKHCEINYEYSYFGDDAPMMYSCSCGSVETFKFMLRDKRVSHKFNISENAYKGFSIACTSYRLEMIKFLLDAPETKDFCNIQNNDFKIIKILDKEDRWYKIDPLKEVVGHLIMNLEFNIVQEMKKHIVKNKEMMKPFFDARELHEELNQNIKTVNKIKKI